MSFLIQNRNCNVQKLYLCEKYYDMLKFLRHICQLIMSPGNGWEDISYSGDDPSKLATAGLYPLFALASVSIFVQYFYESNLELVTLLQYAIITFAQFFITYFCAMVIFASTMEKCVEGDLNEKKYITVITYSLAIMSLITFVQNLIPVEISIVYFLYLYIGVVLWKSTRYLAVKENETVRFMVIAVSSILGIPYLLGALMRFLIM